MTFSSSLLAAKIRTLWAAEKELATRFTVLAHTAEAGRLYGVANRLNSFAEFSRSHAARALSCITRMGPGPMPLPSHWSSTRASVPEELLKEAGFVELLIRQYQQASEMARQVCDLSTAWVCEVSATQHERTAHHLRELAASEGPATPGMVNSTQHRTTRENDDDDAVDTGAAEHPR